MRNLLYIAVLSSLMSISVSGQTGKQTITGQVSFISSTHVYVRFRSTAGINPGDTLFFQSGATLVPALIVDNLSSTSCLCKPVAPAEALPAGHVILAKINQAEEQKKEEIKTEPAVTQAVDTATPVNSPTVTEAGTVRNQRVTGSISAASYSDLSNSEAPSNQSFRYRLSLNAVNIARSRLSARTYMTLRQRKGLPAGTGNSNSLNIYSLSLKYDFDSAGHIAIGRQMNTRLASMGSFDGLELEKSWNRVSAGIIGGARPDYNNFGFNPKLAQYGAYLAYDRTGKSSSTGTSAAFVEQMNSGKTDRRFLYFQHSGSLSGKASMFTSFETDLFNPDKKGPELTSLYLSASYRFSRAFSLNASYDARKNIIYYETYRTIIDSLMENSLRQSFRIGSDIRLGKAMLLGLRSSLRYLKSDIRQAKSFSGYLNWNNTGTNLFSASLTGNYIETSFIKGLNAGLTLRQIIATGKFQFGAGYNYHNYGMHENRENRVQHQGRADLYWQGPVKISLSADYEITFESSTIYHRLYFQLAKRF